MSLSWPVVRRTVVSGVLAALALASGGIAVVSGDAGPPRVAAAPADPVTPVFSLRRVAPAISRTVAGERLRGQLDGLLGQPAYAASRDDTCLVVADPDGRPVFSAEAGKALIPASTMKLLTGAVALNRIGPDATYKTPVKATGPPGADGSVGDLWLVGSGDPLLATADYAAQAGWMQTARPATSLETLADRIRDAGVRRINRLVGDESRYDAQRYLPTWASYYATNPEVGPQSALTVNDGFTQWRPRGVAASAPATHAANTLAALLRARGVTVGATGEGKAPDQATTTVADVESLPLAQVVGAIVLNSGNLGAELLVKELGARFGGAGTTAAGTGVVRATAASLGLPTDGLSNNDGSGLDRGDRLTCDLIQRVLSASHPDGTLAKGLPVAGTSGTLLKRFLGTAAVGKIRAKTGSLAEVAALAGFATGKDGREFAFSLVANDLPTEGAGTLLQNQLATVLAGYPDAPPPDQLGPSPPRPAQP